MAKIVTLKKNNEVIYPVTKAEAVIGGGASYDASWLAAAPPVVATAEQADALCQAISDGIPIYLRYEDVPQGDPYITYATDASTTGGEPVVTFLTGALNGAKTARTYTISRGGMGVQGSVLSSTTTLIDTQTGQVTASNIDFATLGNQESHATAATTLSSTTWQSYLPLTVTAAGKYIVFISARFDGGSQIHDCLITTLKNGSATGPQAQFYGNQTGNISGSLTIATHTSVELAVGDTVALGARVSAGSTSLMARSIALVRIG